MYRTIGAGILPAGDQWVAGFEKRLRLGMQLWQGNHVRSEASDLQA